MPESKEKNELKKKLRIVILIIIGIVSFIVSVGMNVIGMKAVINKETDTSGMAGFSIRTKSDASLGSTQEIKVDSQGKVVEEDLLINCVPLVSLTNSNWDRIKARFTGFQLDEEGNAIFQDGFTLYCNGKYVNYVIFDKTYSKEVVGYIKVGEDLKTIEDKLGVPTFRTKEGIGYKSKQIYVFFYEDEIVVYPNGVGSNRKFEELLNQYCDKSYGKERTYFIIDIRNQYEDFKIEEDVENNTIIITSIARQVIAKLDKLGNIEVELYNGYKIATEETQNNVDQRLYTTNEDDLVEITENERVRSK